MKKLLCMLLAAALCVAAAGCAHRREVVTGQPVFLAKVLSVNWDVAVVEPLEGQAERNSADKLSFSVKDLERIGAHEGSIVEITYDGNIMETYPTQITATKWALAKNTRHIECTDQWLDKEVAEKQSNDMFDHIVIKEIYANCFFAETVIPMPWQIKLNGTLSEDWCVGDQVQCTYENTWWDSNTRRIEADLLTIEASSWQPDPNACYKPVIYLYPEEETEASVKLDVDGGLTCTYPTYKDGWQVIAKPDGTLVDGHGQTYNYLYWEGLTDAEWDLSRGFCVKGEDTAVFLEQALAKLGLNRKEANEFIVYWLPLMQENPYNIIAFQTDVYENAARLKVSPTPDTVIRVFMAWQASDTLVELPVQELTAPERTGFTLIEWGGTQVRNG